MKEESAAFGASKRVEDWSLWTDRSPK